MSEHTPKRRLPSQHTWTTRSRDSLEQHNTSQPRGATNETHTKTPTLKTGCHARPLVRAQATRQVLACATEENDAQGASEPAPSRFPVGSFYACVSHWRRDHVQPHWSHTINPHIHLLPCCVHRERCVRHSLGGSSRRVSVLRLYQRASSGAAYIPFPSCASCIASTTEVAATPRCRGQKLSEGFFVLQTPRYRQVCLASKTSYSRGMFNGKFVPNSLQGRITSRTPGEVNINFWSRQSTMQ